MTNKRISKIKGIFISEKIATHPTLLWW